MKTIGIFLSIAALSLGIYTANGNSLVTGEYAQLFQSDGITGIGAGKIGILVADEGSVAGIVNPFNTVLTVGNYLGGSSDDRIVGIVTSIANVAGTGFSGFQKDFDIGYSGNFNAGDKLYLLWFPTVTTAGSTVGSGVSYGIYRSDVVNTASGADIAFVAPADGSTANMSAYSNSIFPGSGVTTADFTASQITAVPEPSAYALLGLAAFGGVLMRRQLKRFVGIESLARGA